MPDEETLLSRFRKCLSLLTYTLTRFSSSVGPLLRGSQPLYRKAVITSLDPRDEIIPEQRLRDMRRVSQRDDRGLSLNARKFFITHLVYVRTFLAP